MGECNSYLHVLSRVETDKLEVWLQHKCNTPPVIMQAVYSLYTFQAKSAFLLFVANYTAAGDMFFNSCQEFGDFLFLLDHVRF